ncbi:MAG: DNA polymerase III subunit beta [Coriobacteriia bacterium]|nr:DNA polymerase III subunit beta [Coriobacteriia bacterium]
MKIIISKNELVTGFETVLKATASRTSVPALAGVLISIEGENISFFATDLETSIKTTVPGIIEETGAVAVPGKIFSSIIRSLPESSVIIETQNELVNISCNQAHFTINSLNASDFTRFPDISGIEKISLPSEVLGSMVRKVAKAVSRDDTRAILTGILLTIDGEIVKMVATDSYRLALVEKYLEQPAAEAFEVLVPGKAFEEVVKMVGSVETIDMTITSNQIMFSFGTTAYVTRRLEGNFPNYRQLIPKEWKAKITTAHQEFSDSVKRVSLLALNNAAIKIVCNLDEQQINLSAKAQDVGNAEETLSVKVEGESQEISFNHSFIQDGLSVIDNEFVTLEIQDAMKPGLLRSPEEGFTYLMMPVRATS